MCYKYSAGYPSYLNIHGLTPLTINFNFAKNENYENDVIH